MCMVGAGPNELATTDFISTPVGECRVDGAAVREGWAVETGAPKCSISAIDLCRHLPHHGDGFENGIRSLIEDFRAHRLQLASSLEIQL